MGAPTNAANVKKALANSEPSTHEGKAEDICSCFDVQLVMTRRAFIAVERPVGMVDRMLGHPFSNADLALDHAALKGDVALVAVGDDFFDTISGACRQNMTENGHKRHEHQTFLSPAVDTCKTDASRGDGRGLRPRRRHDCAPEVSAPHLELRVSPMTGAPLNGGL